MKERRDAEAYALEMTGIFVSALGMMLLLVIGVWVSSMLVIGSNVFGEQTIGTERYEENSDRFSYFREVAASANSGRVAGIVDDSSEDEDRLRNQAAEWLGNVREVQSLPVAYRDSVLDRNAQNQARFIATSCSADRYSDWDESLGRRVDEGFVSGFSESIFDISGDTFTAELPLSQSDYARLFTFYDAVGLGVAKYAEGETCGDGLVLVIHAASID